MATAAAHRGAGPRRAAQPMMSSSTKTDLLDRMTRSEYNKSESKLNKQGLSLGNYKHAGVADVTIAYTGGRNGDYAAANVAAGLLATPANYTWRHFEDYHAGHGTMQLVLTNIHAGVHHRGGVWQWEQVNVGAYGP